MSEFMPENFEREQEHIPTPEEVRSVFEQLIPGETKLDIEKSDEQGLYRLEVTVPTADGGYVELGYARRGKFPDLDCLETSINYTYYDADGMPNNGGLAARFLDNQWVIIEKPDLS